MASQSWIPQSESSMKKQVRKPVCVYSVTAPDNFNGEETFGMLYYADIHSFEPELHSEIERIVITDQLVDQWTYPLIQPKLIDEAKRRECL